jgi:serine/threonine protein kinase
LEILAMSRDRSVVEKVMASLKNIGNFELSPLRESEQGSCFKAVDTGRRIAVSIRTAWPNEAPNSASYLQKLQAQARSAQALENGNIAKVIGSGELDGAFFIVSSFVDGRSLRQNLNSGENLNVWDLIDFARQACVGLESAHARGLIHHALHPDNVVLEFDGSTKILDVGLYRSYDPQSDAFSPAALYLAPEQLAGQDADRITNFYSVAIMLYEIATGKLPFTGDNWESLLLSAQGEIPEPIQLNASLPKGINAAIVKALSRDRSARFQGGPELVRALEDYKSFDKPVVAPPTPALPKQIPIQAATAVAPARNPYSPAPEPHSLSLGLQDAPAPWKPPAAPPQPAPAVDLPAPPVEPPSKQEVAKEIALEITRQAHASAKKTIKRVDPWIASLAVLVLILVSFLARTVALSFSGSSSHAESAAPPASPAPAPAAVVPIPSLTANTAAEETSSEPEVIVRHASDYTTNRKGRKTSAKGSALFSAAHPLPAGNAPATTGSVVIATVPSGANVVVDGNASQPFITPQVIASLQPGVHTLTITKEGYAPATRPIEITAGAESKLTVQLEVPAGFLTVISNPANAYIVIDGASTGHVTPSQVQVAPGQHTVTLRKMGYLEASDSFNMRAGEQQSRNVSLLPAGSTPEIRVAQTGGLKKLFGNKVSGVRLSVRSNPAGATVLINGQAVGKSTPVEFGLNPGNYTLELQFPGYQAVHKTITVEEGKPLAFDESLHP